MKIALVHRIHVNPIFATVDQKRNAPYDQIHVQLGNVNVARMTNVHLHYCVLWGSAQVNNNQSQKSIDHRFIIDIKITLSLNLKIFF